MSDDPVRTFYNERQSRIASYQQSKLADAGKQFMRDSTLTQYSYNYDWLSRPIIQYPQDIVAMQELIWSVRPDLIIETGIAHGGSAIFSASMLALMEYCDAAENGEMLDPASPKRRVIAVDIDIRSHNKKLIETHPMANRIEMLEGSSTDEAIVSRAHEAAAQANTVLVCLDSNHTAEHVLAELQAYAPMTSQGSYCVVFDTFVEDHSEDLFTDKPWSPGDSPKTAVFEYLNQLKTDAQSGLDGQPLQFEIDKTIDNKLLISVAPDGYLKRLANTA